MARSTQKKSKGFTLVEIVVGIVVSAIALTFLSTLFFSNAGRSVEPLLQIRAAEFGQALMDEILAKNFDETTPVGGYPACNPCSTIAGDNTDADGEARVNFDDVDDYNVYCPVAGNVIDSRGINLSASGEPFENFRMQVCVSYDDAYNGTLTTTGVLAKLITVDIFPSGGAGLGGGAIRFQAYKGNF